MLIPLELDKGDAGGIAEVAKQSNLRHGTCMARSNSLLLSSMISSV